MVPFSNLLAALRDVPDPRRAHVIGGAILPKTGGVKFPTLSR